MEPLAELAELIRQRDEMPRRLAEKIDEAREQGATWEQIGEVLGTTHSGAIKAHHRWTTETNR